MCLLGAWPVQLVEQRMTWGTGHQQHGYVSHSTAQRSTTQHSTAQHSTAQHSTMQQRTAERGPQVGCSHRVILVLLEVLPKALQKNVLWCIGADAGRAAD